MTATLVRRVWPFIILALSAQLAAPPVVVTTFVVNDPGDLGDANIGDHVCATVAGKCTLRAAIDEANASGGTVTTVTIPSMIIALRSMLTVKQPVSIQGAGPAVTVIDGGSPDLAVSSVRGFYFIPNSGSHSVSGLTIRNMGVTSATDPDKEALRTGNGGAILNEAALSLSNVTIDGNKADSGAGIYNMYDFIGGANNAIVPSLTLNNIVLSNNRTTSTTMGRLGGGLFNGGALDGTNVTITGNSAYQGAGWYNNNPHQRGIYYVVAMRNFSIDHNTAYTAAGLDNDLSTTLTLVNGAISNNTATAGMGQGGGAIYNNYDYRTPPLYVLMTLTDVTLSGNQVTGGGGLGGGIVNIQAMSLDRVTISGNSATYGAGIHNGSPNSAIINTLMLTNTTISGNTGITIGNAQSRGGGVFNTYNGVVMVTNSTITRNSAVASGGIDNYVNLYAGNSVTLASTIVANDVGTAPFPPECQGNIASGGFNLLGDITGCNFASRATDRTNIPDPGLGPLQNNGGATFTHALLPASLAIDAVVSGCPPPAVDQRGVARPQQLHCDAGAFEFRPGVDSNRFPIYLPLIAWNTP